MTFPLYTGDAILRAAANVAASATDSVVVPATAGRKIRVLSVFLDNGAGGSTTLTFNSKGAGAGVTVSQLISMAASGGVVLPKSDTGWYETNSGESLTATTSAGAAVGVFVTYILV